MGNILSSFAPAAGLSINKDIIKMHFIVYFVIMTILCTFIKETNKDHYCDFNLNELSLLSSLTENIREINQWIGGDPNIKYELTYSKFGKKSKRMDHFLVKLKFLFSDALGLNYFCESDSEHYSSFNGGFSSKITFLGVV